MEAMFDRMDAIGKGILGLTIQCAQCLSWTPKTGQSNKLVLAVQERGKHGTEAEVP